MIYNNNPIYAKVWKVTPAENGKFIDLQVTTSEKDANGDYINSNWFPRAIGKAVNTLKKVKADDRIIIKSSKFTNERREMEDGSKKSFFRFLILDAEIETNEKESSDTPANNKTTPPQTADEPSTPPVDECPW